MQVTCDETDAALVVRLAGEVVMDAVSECRDAVERRAKASPAPVVTVDLADVAFMDSSGVGFLIGLRRLCQEHGKALALANPSPPIKKLLDMLRLTPYFAGPAA